MGYFTIIPLEEFTRDISRFSCVERNKYNELFFVSNGSFIKTMDLVSIRINRNEIHLSLEEQIGSIAFSSDNLSGYYCAFNNKLLTGLHLNDDFVKDLMFINSFMGCYPLRLSKTVLERMRNTFSYLYKLNQSFSKNKSLIIAYLATIISEAKHILLQIEMDLSSSKSLLIVKQFHDLLAKQITLHQSISSYASQLGITPNHLNKLVKAVTGKTAVMLRNDMLLLEAKMQLKQTCLSVSEIAFNIGFSDLSYFSRFFKKATGLTPLQYRNN